MAGRIFAARATLRQGLAAGMVVLLSGCTALPVPAALPAPEVAYDLTSAAGVPAASEPALPASKEPVPALPEPSIRSRFTDFIARRLHVPVDAREAPAEEATPPIPDAVVDEKYQLTGEAALELERGRASWYGGQFHGRRTASGENYDKYALTAAHKTLPFGTIVRVRSLALGREVDVRINDRGPFSPGRVIDVSQAAAEALGLTAAGVAEVSLNVAAELDNAVPSRPRKKLSRRPAAKTQNSYRH